MIYSKEIKKKQKNVNHFCGFISHWYQRLWLVYRWMSLLLNGRVKSIAELITTIYLKLVTRAI